MAEVIPTENFSPLNFQRFAPHPRLAPWVQCLWSIGTQTPNGHQNIEKFYPDGGASLTIGLSTHEPVITFEQNTCTSMRLVRATDACVSIRFTPTGAYFLLGLEPQELSDKQLCLGRDYTPQWHSSLAVIATRLYNLDLVAKISVLEQWLLQRLTKCASRQAHTWKLVHAIKMHPLPPGQLEKHLGVNRRTLERTFKRQIGISPGQYIGYCRTHQARRLLAASTMPLADIALECGYYDQPHFSHAFQKSTFETPAEYRARKLSQIYKA